MTREFVGYAFRKTLATGFIDMALLIANVSQLKVITEHDMFEPNFKTMFTISLIGTSIIMQIIVGCMLVYLGKQENTIISNHPSRAQDMVGYHNGARANQPAYFRGVNLPEGIDEIDGEETGLTDDKESVITKPAENKAYFENENEKDLDQTDSSSNGSTNNRKELHIVVHLDQQVQNSKNAGHQSENVENYSDKNDNAIVRRYGDKHYDVINHNESIGSNSLKQKRELEQEHAHKNAHEHEQRRTIDRTAKYSFCEEGDTQCMHDVNAHSSKNSLALCGIFVIMVINVIVSGLGLNHTGGVVSRDGIHAVMQMVNGTSY